MKINNEHESSHASQDVFNNPEIFIEKFDGADRDEWQKPDEVIKSFNIGAGTGYFSVRLAEQVRNGKVICFEQASKMAEYLQNRVRDLGLTNVEVRSDGTDGVFTLEKQADVIFSVDVYHHIQDPKRFFAKVAQNLSTDGVLVVIDRTEEKIEGQPTGHRVPAEKVIEEMGVAGFELVEKLDFLLPVQYYLSFKRTQ
jgi:SAM-dependent methyltransferase